MLKYFETRHTIETRRGDWKVRTIGKDIRPSAIQVAARRRVIQRNIICPFGMPLNPTISCTDIQNRAGETFQASWRFPTAQQPLRVEWSAGKRFCPLAQ